MTSYDVSHWSISDGKIGLLLFAQSLEELLSPHSHDSYKVPALNFHYICYEILNVIELIEEEVLDKGNLIPLFSEIRFLFENDQIAQKFFGRNFNDIFSKKNAKGEYDRRPIKLESGKDVEENLQHLKKCIKYVVAELELNRQYYNALIGAVKDNILSCGEDLHELSNLQYLTKNVATELTNMGFSQRYIYDQIMSIFFTAENKVDDISVVDDFFDAFPSKPHDYVVYMPISNIKQKRAFEEYGMFEIAENVYDMFQGAFSYILKFETRSWDPYRAREEALNLINFCLSVNQFIKHNKYEYNPRFAEVVDKEDHKVTFIIKPEMPIFCGYKNCEQMEINELLKTCTRLRYGIFQVFQLHSAALISRNSGNQLINLWTAVEVAVPVLHREGISRINQISNVLTTALSQDYFEGLIRQLLIDIKAVDEDMGKCIETVNDFNSDEERMLAVLIFPEYADLHNEIIDRLVVTAPLLACRIEQYKNRWANTKDVAIAYKSHVERLSQQIMRIYRTRNMLVHDGESMPYSDYVLQNLHYYIDSFIEFLNKYCKNGYKSIQAIIDAAQFREQRYLQSLSENKPIDKNNMRKYIFRGSD